MLTEIALNLMVEAGIGVIEPDHTVDLYQVCLSPRQTVLAQIHHLYVILHLLIERGGDDKVCAQVLAEAF
jgi:hypothetical protein